jgi:DNA processing protein
MDVDTLAAWYALDSVKGFGPGKCRALYAAGMSPQAALGNPDELPFRGKTGERLAAGIAAVDDPTRTAARENAYRDLETASRLEVAVLGYADSRYPSRVLDSNYPVPFLFVRGDATALDTRSVACVGSRQIAGPYADRQSRFAGFAASMGLTVVSGFATGADTIAHDAAVDVGGRTVAVLPCGLDLVFPPENRDRWERWRSLPGVAFVSDFRFGRRADALALRKRNKLIVACSGGVLVGQSSDKGGAMNAYRFALEQRKPVATFAPDGTDATSGNAQIGASNKVPASTFPADRDAPDEWRMWTASLDALQEG